VGTRVQKLTKNVKIENKDQFKERDEVKERKGYGIEPRFLGGD